MKCEKIQALILTDYTDGELAEKARLEVEGHMRACSACRAFETVMIEKITQPFAHAIIKETPPDYLLERVKRRIASKQRKCRDILEDVRGLVEQILLSLAKIPRPVVAFAAAAMIIVAIMIARPFIERDAMSDYMGEQLSFIADLDALEANGANIFDTDIKTGAEKFL